MIYLNFFIRDLIITTLEIYEPIEAIHNVFFFVYLLRNILWANLVVFLTENETSQRHNVPLQKANTVSALALSE